MEVSIEAKEPDSFIWEHHQRKAGKLTDRTGQAEQLENIHPPAHPQPLCAHP